MKRTLSMVAVMLLGCAAAVAPARGDAVSIYQATLAEPGQKTAEVSTEEMRHVVAGDDVLIIDSRTRAEFDAGHIPGAHVLDVPQSEQVTAVARLVGGDKSKSLVLYCNGPFCGASRRLADQLLARGFTHVRRYQLGIPVWRALGGPVEVEIEGIARVLKLDRTAVFVDGRSTAEFASGSLEGAHSAPVDELASGALKKLPLPEDDFNRRVILFAHDAAAARRMADVLSKLLLSRSGRSGDRAFRQEVEQSGSGARTAAPLPGASPLMNSRAGLGRSMVSRLHSRRTVLVPGWDYAMSTE